MNSIGRPKKSAVDMIQTIFWYEYINMLVCASNLERKISMTTKETVTYQTHANKIAYFFDQIESGAWYKYRDGIKKPSKTTLEYIEIKFENSSFYFNHPLWDFLKSTPSNNSLMILYQQLEPKTHEAIESGKILDPSKPHPNYDVESLEFLTYSNFLDFWAYILYVYYQAKNDLDLEALMNTVVFFEKNIPVAFQFFGELSPFFLDIYSSHLKKPKEIQSLDWMSWCERNYLSVEEIISLRNQNRYERLNQLLKVFSIS